MTLENTLKKSALLKKISFWNRKIKWEARKSQHNTQNFCEPSQGKNTESSKEILVKYHVSGNSNSFCLTNILWQQLKMSKTLKSYCVFTHFSENMLSPQKPVAVRVTAKYHSASEDQRKERIICTFTGYFQNFLWKRDERHDNLKSIRLHEIASLYYRLIKDRQLVLV